MENTFRDFFIESERLLKNISDFNRSTSSYFHNAPYAYQKCKALLEFMKKEKPILEEWCRNFLQENRNKIYVRYWFHQGWKFLNGHNHGTGNLRFLESTTLLHRNFQEEWETINTTLGNKKEYNFQDALSKLEEAHEKQDVRFCTVPEILKIHEGKKCESNGWYCDDCEDMEHAWHRHLITKLQETQNIFLNKGCKRRFLETMDQREIVPEEWEPPLNNPLTQIRNLELKTDGKTGYQIMYMIVEFTTWQIRLWEPSRDDLSKFFEAWEFLGTLDKKLGVLEKALEDIQTILFG